MVAHAARDLPGSEPHAGSVENRPFLIAHGVLLVLVLIGFARTFYLRPWLARNPIDTPLTLHGAVLTSWFALAAVQAWLAATRRRIHHRRLAWLAAGIVPAVVVSSAWINTRVAAGIRSASDPENMFVWGNYMSLVAFVGLVAASVAVRRRPDAHRRLLLMASVAIVGPAFARFAFWPAVGLGVAGGPPFAIGGMLLLLGLAVAYDRRTIGRVHGATKAGVAVIVGTLVFGITVAQSGVAFGLTSAGAPSHAPAAAGTIAGS
jgi:hypothetical protein